MFALMLAVMMLLCALPVSAEETTEPTSPERAPGYCGEAIVWDFHDGILTITGTGAMDDFPQGAPWAEHKEEIDTVIISGGITYIGAYSFSDYDKLTDVQFGKDVYEIGERAFFSCDGLTKVYLPASFRVFGPSSFMGCSKLKEFHCEGKFPSFRLNCLWDTYAVIYFPAARPWNVKNIRDLEEAFHGRIEFLASDGSDPYVPTEAPAETEAPTEAPTEETTEPTEAPTTAPPTTEAPTEEITEPAPTEAEVTEAPTQAPAAPPTEPKQEPEEKGGSKAGFIIIGGVAVFLILGSLVFGGGRKKGKYSR
jgi:hypothetical protein